jgi:hypothetical protein
MLLTLIHGSTGRIFPSHIKSAPGIEEQPVCESCNTLTILFPRQHFKLKCVRSGKSSYVTQIQLLWLTNSMKQHRFSETNSHCSTRYIQRLYKSGRFILVISSAQICSLFWPHNNQKSFLWTRYCYWIFYLHQLFQTITVRQVFRPQFVHNSYLPYILYINFPSHPCYDYSNVCGK